MGTKVPSWERVSGWLTRLILILFVILEASIWLDVLIQTTEYERLIGSESACGKFESYCFWPAYALSNVFFMALSGLAIIGLLWRGLPRRELMLARLRLSSAYIWPGERTAPSLRPPCRDAAVCANTAHGGAPGTGAAPA